MKTFKMQWPGLEMEVLCEGIEKNEEALDIFLENMPVKALQGHEMTGGWILRDRAVHLIRKPFDITAAALGKEKMNEAPVGRISLLDPCGTTTELLVKYNDCVDDREYIPIAQVREEDLSLLRKAAKAQWQSATREQKTIIVQFTQEEGGR